MFGVAFLLAAALFAWHARKGTLRFSRPCKAADLPGLLLVAYALVGYPLVGLLAGHEFTTHTPVPAGHDQFDRELVAQLLREPVPSSVLAALERRRRLGKGKVQLVFAGKAHPRDSDGKRLIERIFAAGRALGEDVPLVYLENCDLALAGLLVAGADLWLNTPLRPLEASGTSDMKAAHNGVPSLSVLDGWWVEGCVEDVTGWSIGQPYDPSLAPSSADRIDAADLYRKLEEVILTTFVGDRPRWISVMQHAIALNASYFNAHRMVPVRD